MKNGLTAYKEIREEAKKVYQEIGAYKCLAPQFTLMVREKENGLVDLVLNFWVTYQYVNNHTRYAKAQRSFRVVLDTDLNKDITLELFAKQAKELIERETVNKNVEICFIEHEEEEWF